MDARLRQALETAQTECPRLSPDALVIYNNDRGQFIRKTFNNRWLKAVRAAQSELGRQLDYTFHDIKAKAISDFEGSSRDKQIFSGHKTESQVLIYDRKVKQPDAGSSGYWGKVNFYVYGGMGYSPRIFFFYSSPQKQRG